MWDTKGAFVMTVPLMVFRFSRLCFAHKWRLGKLVSGRSLLLTMQISPESLIIRDCRIRLAKITD